MTFRYHFRWIEETEQSLAHADLIAVTIGTRVHHHLESMSDVVISVSTTLQYAKLMWVIDRHEHKRSPQRFAYLAQMLALNATLCNLEFEPEFPL